VANGAQTVEQKIRERFGTRTTELRTRGPRRVYVGVLPKDLEAMALFLWDENKARFQIASGLQTREGFEVLYHFAFDELGVVCSVRVKTSEKERPVLPSLAPKIKATNFIEREMNDLLGIRFEGHPDPTPLLRAEDWPAGYYPLRRTETSAELNEEKK
jgi:Ni,Fe-hydrogenase III component G